MLVTHGQSSMRRTEFLTSHQTCASGSQRELSASCLSPWQRGEDWAGGWTGRERSQKEGKRWVEGRDPATNQHLGWAEPSQCHAPATVLSEKSVDFPAPLLQVQSCPSVCCCPEHSSPLAHPAPSPEPHSTAQPSTATGDVCCTHHLGFSHTTSLDLASDFRLRSVTLGLLSERENSKKMGCSHIWESPRSCHLCHLIYWAAPCPFQDNSGWQLLSARPGSSFIKAPSSPCQFISLLPTDSFSI